MVSKLVAIVLLHIGSAQLRSQSAGTNNSWWVETFAGSGATGRRPPCKESPGSHVDGAASSARFASAAFVQVLNDTLYVTDSMNGCIRAIERGIVSSFTPCCTADVGTTSYGPQCSRVTRDSLYMMDTDNNQLKFSLRPFSGNWTVLAGNGSRPVNGRSVDGPALGVPLNAPHGFTVHRSGDIYIADTFSSCIRLLRAGQITTVAGRCGFGGYADGLPDEARFQHVHRVDLDPRNQSELYVSDAQCFDDGGNEAVHSCSRTDRGICFSGIRKIILNQSTGQAVQVTTVAGQVTSAPRDAESHSCRGYADGRSSDAFFNHVHGVGFPPLTDEEEQRLAAGLPLAGSRILYVMDENGNRVRVVDIDNDTVGTVAGNGRRGVDNGPGESATFIAPAALDLDSAGNIYVADWGSNRIRLVRRDAGDVGEIKDTASSLVAANQDLRSPNAGVLI